MSFRSPNPSCASKLPPTILAPWALPEWRDLLADVREPPAREEGPSIFRRGWQGIETAAPACAAKPGAATQNRLSGAFASCRIKSTASVLHRPPTSIASTTRRRLELSCISSRYVPSERGAARPPPPDLGSDLRRRGVRASGCALCDGRNIEVLAVNAIVTPRCDPVLRPFLASSSRVRLRETERRARSHEVLKVLKALAESAHPELAELGAAIARQNGYGEVIEFVCGKPSLVQLPGGEKADIIVSLFMGYFLMYEARLEELLQARDRFLKPDGLMFPDRAKLFVSLMEDPDYKRSHYEYFGDVWGFDFSAMKEAAMSEPVVQEVNESHTK
ncbi:unnamed protein product [Effrenium voratum]|nr:unnamed protein product [Effrenium voratum]